VPQSHIIHEDKNCLVVHQTRHSGFTLITFGGIGHRPNANWFWGKAAVDKLGFDSIGIVPKSDHRYPRGAMEHIVPVINAHSKATRIGYGFSMGAYGALKHGRLLGLTHVLALSPVNYALTSAKIRKIVWDGRFCPERNQGLLISSQETAPVNLQVLDPFFPLDFEQGELFASAGRIHTIRTPFTDHFTIGLLRSTENLKNTIKFLLEEDFGSISALLNESRRTAPERAVNLARASLARGNRMRASKLWQKAFENGVKSDAIERARISGLVEFGRRYLASCFATEIQGREDFIEKISLEYPNSLRLQRELAHWCIVYAAPKAALSPLRRAVEIAPSDIDRWLALGRALHAAGQTKEALGILQEALTACDDSKEIVLLINYLKQNFPLRVSEKRWNNPTKRLGLAIQTKKMVVWRKYLSWFVGK